MSNSYRIRTQVGVDKSVKVYLDQDFEYLEILSLKLLQSQIYTRPCSDYGAVVGRVSVNNGFGIPNAKVSIFIPLTPQDEENPIISQLYPYKTISTRNDDGYRYNLLPYVQQHGGHTPTGTFFDREDVLIDTTLIQVYDKYYKYTARTNDSGDFMLFGVPLGSQTIHIDIDLSDIGEFSLFPQDLVRMGLATENQVAGTRFRSSNNLGELPQIISMNRTIDIEPLWGQEDLCNIGITRTDFDLSDALNLRIEPTAIFMGSIFSSNDFWAQKRNCSVRLRQGRLCSLISGPGEILAIRQTIFQDEYGRPALQRYVLEEGGRVIDEDGTWVVEVPMNLDYVTTDEFGQQVTSLNPNVGIPTKGRYRFKIKWNQPPTMREPVKRGYFLVPNIRECGWSGGLPDDDPFYSQTLAAISPSYYRAAVNSYAFSLDWNDYGETGTTVGDQMILDAIRCEDRFYEFQYNKVYTVSELITQYRRGRNTNRIIAIKDILDDFCETDILKFPTNDANYRIDILYLFFSYFMVLMKIILIVLVIVAHILAFALYLIGILVAFTILIIGLLVLAICSVINWIIDKLNDILNSQILQSLGIDVDITPLPCPDLDFLIPLVEKIVTFYQYFGNYKLPVLTYPDCEFCECELPNPNNGASGAATGSGGSALNPSTSSVPTVIGSVISQYYNFSNYTNFPSPITVNGVTNSTKVRELMAGYPITNPTSSYTRVPQSGSWGQDSSGNNILVFTTSLTLAERINLFNTKAKYFNDTIDNPGGGVNQIEVKFNPTANPGKSHTDNMLVMSCKASSLPFFTAGKVISFQNPQFSTDVNLTGLTTLNDFGTFSTTGSTIGTPVGGVVQRIYPLNYANPNGSGNLSVPGGYVVTGDTGNTYHRFAVDIEYFQVVTAMTYSTYSSFAGVTLPNSLNTRILNNDMRFEFLNKDTGSSGNNSAGEWFQTSLINPIQTYGTGNDEVIVFLVRGVDPYSSRNYCEYDLNKLFGNLNFGTNPNLIIKGQYKLNIPIQGSWKPSNHDDFATDAFLPSDNYANIPLYYPAFTYKDSITGPGSFSSFTSNLPSYYSKLTNGTILSGNISDLFNSINPNSGFNLQSITTDAFPEGTKISNGSVVNGFSIEFSNPSLKDDCAPGIGTVVTRQAGSSSNRGYLSGEVVDGGSLFLQYTNPNTLGLNFFYCAPYSYPGYLYSPRYSTTITYDPTSPNFNGENIVMRAERLPTSTSLEDSGNNSFALQNNSAFTVYEINDNGIIQPTSSLGTTGGIGVDPNDTFSNEDEAGSPILQSFSCENLVPLGCYDTVSGDLVIKPPTDDCYYTDVLDFTFSFTIPVINVTVPLVIEDKPKMKGGCYNLVSAIFFSLLDDIKMILEWSSRTQINFAACRNVFAHMFTNNWINGTLYAFPINNDRFYTDPNASEPNKGYSLYCKNTMHLDNNNNYYYRVSPYTDGNEFIGQPSPRTPIFGNVYGGNNRNLMFPVTVMDLGPKNAYIQELVMSSQYDGFVVDKIGQTTFQDVEEVLNTFIINRLTDATFLQQLIGGQNVSALSFFNERGNRRMVDGDYAQAISVNSELGVAALQAENYPANPLGTDPIYFNWSSGQDRIFGIFYTGDTQIRDWISPKRTIVVPSANTVTSQICAFNNYGVFSQIVPFYQWENKDNKDAGNPSYDSIFGSQKNDWYTVGVNGQNFFKYRYQSMDRINPSCRYFRPLNNTSQSFFRGYIYAVTPGSTFANTNLSTSRNDWDTNAPIATAITVGAPFHFYFGIKRGATAWDKFAIKYVEFDTIEDV